MKENSDISKIENIQIIPDKAICWDAAQRKAVQGDMFIGDVYQWAYPIMLSSAFRILRNQDDAEDIAQESLIEFRRILSDRQEAIRNLQGFVHGIAIHNSIDLIRFRKRQTDLRIRCSEQAVISVRGRDFCNRVALQRAVAKAMKVLSPRDRDIVHLRYYEELTCKEIAAKLSISPKTVQRALLRSAEKLKARLEGNDE